MTNKTKITMPKDKPAGASGGVADEWPTDAMVIRGAEKLHDLGVQCETELQQYIVESVFNEMLAAAPEAPADEIKVPTTEDEAAGMVLIGTAWLEQHAPHRLRQKQPSVPADVAKDASRYRAIRSGAAYIEPHQDGQIYVATDRGVYCKTASEVDALIDAAIEHEQATAYALHCDRMAALLQELVYAPEVLEATNPSQISSAAEPSADVARDAERLDWLLRKLPGDALRCCVGVLSDTSDEDAFREAIDAAIAAEKGGQS